MRGENCIGLRHFNVPLSVVNKVLETLRYIGKMTKLYYLFDLLDLRPLPSNMFFASEYLTNIMQICVHIL